MRRSPLAYLFALTFATGLALGTVPAWAGSAAPGTVMADDKKTVLVDLNSASKAELMKLPAVGDAIADRIVAGRPWRSKYDLVVKKVVTRSQYDKFAKLVVARQ